MARSKGTEELESGFRRVRVIGVEFVLASRGDGGRIGASGSGKEVGKRMIEDAARGNAEGLRYTE